MEESNIDYQFVKVPLNLFCRLDKNLRSMLFTLIQLQTKFAEDDGWFFRNNDDLAKQSKLSENLVRITTDALYKEGLIDVQSVGKGKGSNSPSNRYIVHLERFKDYEKDDIVSCFKDPRLEINTPEYKGSHYHPSYLDKHVDVVRTETVMVDDMVNEKVDDEVNNVVEKLVKSEDNINNIYNIDNKNNIKNNIYNNIKDNNLINNNNILNNKNNLLNDIDLYFNSGLHTYEDLKTKSLFIEKISSISEITDTKELLPSMIDVYRFITDNQHMFVGSKVQSLRDKVEELFGAKRKELEQNKKA